MNTISIKVEVLEEEHLILSKLQSDIKEKTGKKVALSKIVLEFFKKGLQKDQKVGFTQNEIDESNLKERFTQNEIDESNLKERFTQNEIGESNSKERFTQNKEDKSNEKTHSTQNKATNTQNLEPFVQNLVAKQLQKTQNEYKLNTKLKNDYSRIERKEKELRYFEQELKNEREELFAKRRELLKSQEIVNAKHFETREKDFEIRLLQYKMKKLGENYIEKHKIQINEIKKQERENNIDNEKYENRISILRDEKQNLLEQLFEFKNTIKDLEFSNKSLINTIKDYVFKKKEKTFSDQIEPFLPAIMTILVLLIKDKKVVETIRKEFLAIFKKPK